MSRALAHAALVVVASGCLPDLPPPPADGADDDTTGEVTATVGASDSMTAGLTETMTDTDTTGDDDDDSTETTMDGGSDTTMGEPSDECPAIDPLVVEGDGVSNCRLAAEFDLDVVRGLSELRAPGGSDENLLFEGAPTFLEEYAGVMQYPLYASVDSTEPMDKLGEHWVSQDGPAVYRIWIPWIVDAGGSMGVEGLSIYTVLADGRIFRDESMHVFEEVGTWLVAFVALRPTALPTVYWGGQESGSYDAPVPGNGEQESFYQADSDPVPDHDAYTCAYDSQSGDMVGFAQYEGDYTTWAGPRATFVQETAGIVETSAFVLQADWLRMTSIGSAQLGEYTGEVMMYAGSDTESTPCAAVAEYYDAYRDPGFLTVTAGGATDLPEVLGDESDGDDFSQGGGFYYFRAEGSGDIVMSIEGTAATQPTVLLNAAGLEPSEVSGVSVGGQALSDHEYIVQAANEEAGGSAMGGLDTGAFVLIGVPVDPGVEIVIGR